LAQNYDFKNYSANYQRKLDSIIETDLEYLKGNKKKFPVEMTVVASLIG
jgi:hypothetical protein